MADPAWHGSDSPPQWAVIGQWRSDERGEIVEWQENRDYRPSPGMLGWDEPTDPVDDAMQLAATGYGPLDGIWEALAEAELAVLVHADGELVTACTPDGSAVVPAHTSRIHLASAGALSSQRLPTRAVLERLPAGHDLYLNPAAPVAMRVGPEQLTGPAKTVVASAPPVGEAVAEVVAEVVGEAVAEVVAEPEQVVAAEPVAEPEPVPDPAAAPQTGAVSVAFRLIPACRWWAAPPAITRSTGPSTPRAPTRPPLSRSTTSSNAVTGCRPAPSRST
ncbi:type VII secretion system-associated protein [Streptomyces sp. H10-C2]|uniref:type VII secretion system-associated protein n=1 Tax=unclassified Streptomyces TaxID=2593676 RepID=UPI0024B97E2A|nr:MULTISPECIES: type VII secretion system-associated protein [unclassified Streptomyces]MDJ0344766.1 type VII secretion system-associated protein [Streptomyces sp. PH10-H1]MDJ0371257.1 type VII secretion system-associated protein [Streptomyces sp. H10-C2]